MKFQAEPGADPGQPGESQAAGPKKKEHRNAALKTMALYISEIRASKDLRNEKGDAGKIMPDALKVIEKTSWVPA